MSPLTSRRTCTAVVCLLLVAALRSRAHVPSGDVCPPHNGSPSCVCQHPNGRIDLTPLVNGTGSYPRYTGIGPDENKYLYDYNPCYTFSATAPCTDSHVCQYQDTTFYALGASGTEAIYIDDKDGKVYAHYIAPADDGLYREAWVELVCDQDLTSGKEQLTTTGDKEVSLVYRFVLKSCFACPGGCSGSKGDGGDGGSNVPVAVIVIISFICFILLILAPVCIIGVIIVLVVSRSKGPSYDRPPRVGTTGKSSASDETTPLSCEPI